MIINTTPTSIAAAVAACVAIAVSVDAAVATAASASPGIANQASPAAANPIAAIEGARFSGQVAVLQAQCTSPQNPQATISWGDGGTTSPAEVSVSSSQLSISGSNTYGDEGDFSGTVTGSYTCPSALALRPVTFNASFAATVTDAPMTITQGPSLPAGIVAGHSFIAQIAQFTDADPAGSADAYTATVAWGDGTISTATVAPAGNGFAVTATHAYATAGTYAPEVRISDQGGASVTASGAVQVAPVQIAPVQVAPATARLGVRVEPHVGNGTTVLSLNPTRTGILTIFPVRRHHRVLIAGRTIQVSKAGPLVVVLKPTAAVRRQLARGAALGGVAKLEFTPSGGSTINTFIKVNFTDKYCDGSLIYDYTGAEQSCIVANKVNAVEVLAVGGRGGDVSEPCPEGPGPGCPTGNWGGIGGQGALVDSSPVPVTPGQPLYIEVGGNGGSVYATNEEVEDELQPGAHGAAGGWNGGGDGGTGTSAIDAAGGGGASDVQTVSCIPLCDPHRTLLALDSRLVIAGGGGGGASGGWTGDDTSLADNNQGGNGGDAKWAGSAGSEANQSNGQGGQGGSQTSGGAGGNIGQGVPGNVYGTLNPGANGTLGAGGAGGNDGLPFLIILESAGGFGGGGGGGGLYGGGGGGGGFVLLGAAFGPPSTIGAGGGGGAGSSMGPQGTSVEINPGEQPQIQIIPLVCRKSTGVPTAGSGGKQRPCRRA